jgi:hypothetical protein
MVALTFFMGMRSRRIEAVALLQHVLDSVAVAERSGVQSAQRQGLAAFALTLQSAFFGMLGQVDKHVSGLERSRAAVDSVWNTL